MDFIKIPNKRISLTEEDFTTLVRGNILVKEGVEITLQDIGFNRMKTIIDNREDGNNDDIMAQRMMEESARMYNVFSFEE